MLCPETAIKDPESLVVDSASDPENPYEKALKKLNDPGRSAAAADAKHSAAVKNLAC